MRADLMALLPEALLFLGGMLTLVGGSFTPRTRQWRMSLVAAAATVASLVASLVAWTGGPRAAFSDTFTVDTSTEAARVTVTVSLLLILLIASGEVRDHPRESETYSLLLFGGAGTSCSPAAPTSPCWSWRSCSRASRSTASWGSWPGRVRRRRP